MKTKDVIFGVKTSKKPEQIIAIYDSPECGDRYTVVFTRETVECNPGFYPMYGMSSDPFNPGGFCQFCEGMFDENESNDHLGVKIEWEQLSSDCQQFILWFLYDSRK